MSVKLLTEHCLEFVSLKEAAQARLSLYLSKCHIVLRLNLRYFGFELGTFISQRKGKIQTSTTNLVFHACSAPFHAQVH